MKHRFVRYTLRVYHGCPVCQAQQTAAFQCLGDCAWRICPSWVTGQGNPPGALLISGDIPLRRSYPAHSQKLHSRNCRCPRNKQGTSSLCLAVPDPCEGFEPSQGFGSTWRPSACGVPIYRGSSWLRETWIRPGRSQQPLWTSRLVEARLRNRSGTPKYETGLTASSAPGCPGQGLGCLLTAKALPPCSPFPLPPQVAIRRQPQLPAGACDRPVSSACRSHPAPCTGQQPAQQPPPPAPEGW